MCATFSDNLTFNTTRTKYCKFNEYKIQRRSMSEEFSKLSIKSKSVTSSQSMMWVIPQSRLDRQCPFLEKEYPYFTTDFSMLHYSVKDLEVKLKLILE